MIPSTTTDLGHPAERRAAGIRERRQARAEAQREMREALDRLAATVDHLRWSLELLAVDETMDLTDHGEIVDYAVIREAVESGELDDMHEGPSRTEREAEDAQRARDEADYYETLAEMRRGDP